MSNKDWHRQCWKIKLLGKTLTWTITGWLGIYLTQQKLSLTETRGDSSKGDGEEPCQVGHWYTSEGT